MPIAIYQKLIFKADTINKYQEQMLYDALSRTFI